MSLLAVKAVAIPPMPRPRTVLLRKQVQDHREPMHRRGEDRLPMTAHLHMRLLKV
jgi:hypothetical protein